MPPTPSHLTPSELGSKEYWESTYTADLSTHATNPAHTGTTWFSDSAAEEKILAFLDELCESGTTCLEKSLETPLDRAATTFLDLGTGNGSMLFALREDGWEGQMVGVDYSAKSVELARSVAVERGYASSPSTEILNSPQGTQGKAKEVRFELWDIMTSPPPPPSTTSWFPSQGFSVVLDKGTFDAISLSSEVDNQGRRICEGYRERVERLVGRGGLLLVTSCNWTESELRGWFVQEEGEGDGGGEGGFEVVGRVRYPVYRFGGGEGQSVSSICFRRRE